MMIGGWRKQGMQIEKSADEGYLGAWKGAV